MGAPGQEPTIARSRAGTPRPPWPAPGTPSPAQYSKSTPESVHAARPASPHPPSSARHAMCLSMHGKRKAERTEGGGRKVASSTGDAVTAQATRCDVPSGGPLPAASRPSGSSVRQQTAAHLAEAQPVIGGARRGKTLHCGRQRARICGVLPHLRGRHPAPRTEGRWRREKGLRQKRAPPLKGQVSIRAVPLARRHQAAAPSSSACGVSSSCSWRAPCRHALVLVLWWPPRPVPLRCSGL